MPSIKWNGKNLAAVKKLHAKVAHHPRAAGDDLYRDPSQHPDNLHLEVDGMTVIASLGDTITKDAAGKISVQQTGTKRPTATGRHGSGRVHDVTGGVR